MFSLRHKDLKSSYIIVIILDTIFNHLKKMYHHPHYQRRYNVK